MKKWNKILVVAALAVMISVPAFAWNSSDHVKIAPNNKGDMMIFPFYYASPDGYETRVTIVNTDPVRSVVAKFVVRSSGRSEELIDFLIYLTHNDVWTGTFQYGDQGIEIYSEDDSVLISKDPVTFASEANPMRASFGASPFGLQCSSGDTADFGYVTVIASWWTDLTLINRPAAQPAWTSQWPWDTGANGEPASKEFLYWAYGGDDGMQRVQADGLGCYNTEADQPNFNSFLRGICENINVLTGYMQFNNAVSGMETASALPATIFRDYGNRDYLNIADETIIGNQNQADNVIEEIGAALSKDNLAMPLINTGGDMAAHMLTFPTKLHYASHGCGEFDLEGIVQYDRWDKFWWENVETGSAIDGCINYRRTHYNMQELTAIDPGGVFSGKGGGPEGPNRACAEVQLIPNTPDLSQSEFPMGWYRYDFLNRDETNPCGTTLFSNRESGFNAAGEDSYTGVPVIATVVKFENNKFALMYGAWDNGVVENGTIDADLGDIYPFYQYADDTPEINLNNTPIP